MRLFSAFLILVFFGSTCHSLRLKAGSGAPLMNLKSNFLKTCILSAALFNWSPILPASANTADGVPCPGKYCKSPAEFQLVHSLRKVCIKDSFAPIPVIKNVNSFMFVIPLI